MARLVRLPAAAALAAILALTVGVTAASASTPTFTSAASTTFIAGTTTNFVVTTTGTPPAALTETGSLPSGITFTDHGDGTASIAGTTTVSPGVYSFTIHANNGTDTDQSFSLTVATGGSVFASNGEATPPANAAPTNANIWLGGVSCVSTSNCVGAGSYYDVSGNEQALVDSYSSGTWGQETEVSPPSNADTDPLAELDSVSCTSSGNCVAAGHYNSGGATQSMVATETAGTWGQAVEITGPPNIGSIYSLIGLSAISCPSAGNCVAVGAYDDSSSNERAMVATETAGTWGQAVELSPPADSAASPSTGVDGVSCPSNGNCVAVGSYGTNSGTHRAFEATETAGTWAQGVALAEASNAYTSDVPTLVGVSCVSATSCAAIGRYRDTSGTYQPMAIEKSSGTWGSPTELSLPSDAVAAVPFVGGISCTSAGNCVGVGSYQNASGNAGVTYTESSGTWMQGAANTPPTGADLTAPSGVNLAAISCASAGNCEAVGSYPTASSDTESMSSTESAGSWDQATGITPPADNEESVPWSASLDGISCSSSGKCGAIGRYQDTSSNTEVMVTTESSSTWSREAELTLPSNAVTTSQEGAPGNIACTSAGNCVATGSYVTSGSPASGVFVAQQTSGTWAQAQQIALPGNAYTSGRMNFILLSSVVCTSPGNCLAVGYYEDTSGSSHPMYVTETAGTWGTAQEMSVPSDASASPAAEMESVSCWSAGNCTAVGFYTTASSGRQMYEIDDSSGSWGTPTRLTAPAAATAVNQSYETVSCVSAGNCTAVGTYNITGGSDRPMVLTETGGSWAQGTTLSSPSNVHAAPTSLFANGVSCVSVGNCTEVGWYTDTNGNQQGEEATETGGTWGQEVEVGAPSSAQLNTGAQMTAVSCVAVATCAAVGAFNSDSGSTVTESSSVLIVPAVSLPAATVAATYTSDVVADGGSGTYDFSLSSGSLPAGLSLDPSTGAISGSPTAAGTATFTVSVSDTGPISQQASQSYSLLVDAAAGSGSGSGVGTGGSGGTNTGSSGSSGGSSSSAGSPGSTVIDTIGGTAPATTTPTTIPTAVKGPAANPKTVIVTIGKATSIIFRDAGAKKGSKVEIELRGPGRKAPQIFWGRLSSSHTFTWRTPKLKLAGTDSVQVMVGKKTIDRTKVVVKRPAKRRR